MKEQKDLKEEKDDLLKKEGRLELLMRKFIKEYESKNLKINTILLTEKIIINSLFHKYNKQSS